MISAEQANTTQYFHHGFYGPGGLISDKACISDGRVGWRRNGRTQTWKTRPGEFRIPVKCGLYDYGEVTHLNAAEFYTPDECPMCNTIWPCCPHCADHSEPWFGSESLTSDGKGHTVPCGNCQTMPPVSVITS